MKGIKLSIIIPVLNMEKTIGRTLTNLVSQIQTDIDDIEIIVLDDNSTDKTVEIVRTFSDVTLVEHNEQISTGALRNEGIKLAKKPFIAFLDGDDIMHLDVARKLIKSMGKIVDIGIAGYNKVDYATGNIIEYRAGVFYNIQGISVGKTKELYPILFNSCNAACWNKIFNADFLRRKHIKFNDGCYAEDMCFMRCAMLKSTTYCYIHDSLIDYSAPTSNPNSTDACSAESGIWRDLFSALREVLHTLKGSINEISEQDYVYLLHSFAVDCIGHIVYQHGKFFDVCKEFNEKAIEFLTEVNEEMDYCKKYFSFYANK